jgi:hypothetical protein
MLFITVSLIKFLNYISHCINRHTDCCHILINIPHSCFEYAGICGFPQLQHANTELSSFSEVIPHKLGHLLIKDCSFYEQQSSTLYSQDHILSQVRLVHCTKIPVCSINSPTSYSQYSAQPLLDIILASASRIW